MNMLKCLLVSAFILTVNLTVFANRPDTELVYNTEEVDGIKVSEIVYKKNEGLLTKYQKYSYQYNEERQVIENTLQKWDAAHNEWRNDMQIKYKYDKDITTISYYKWNKSSKEFVLVPSMTATIEK